jgi:phospholipid transport system substrate-binding protein
MVVSVVLAWGTPAMAGETATEAMQSTITEVFRILDDGELKKPEQTEERRRQLDKVIGHRISYEEMAKRSLGTYWKNLSADEKQEFVGLFAALLSDLVANKLNQYTDEQVKFLDERHDGAYAEVRSRLRGSKMDMTLSYRLVNGSGEWRMYDVLMDGISMVGNYRVQFTKIIEKSSYADLVEQLRQKSSKRKYIGKMAAS